LLGTEQCDRHGGIGLDCVVRGNVFGAQLQSTFLAVFGLGQTINLKIQIRQHIVVDDVLEKYGVRIEGFLRQDDAIIKNLVPANGTIPVGLEP
jgi:hypothetical protein